MKIAIVSPKLYPCSVGGLEVFNYHLIKELALRGHHIWVITNCNENWEDENIHCIPIPSSPLNTTRQMMIIQITKQLLKLTSREKINLIHIPYTSNSYLVYPVFFIHKLRKIPYIITIHGGGLYRWKSRIFQYLFFIHAADIIAVSKVIKTEYEKRCNRKIRVIPPLVPFKKFDASKKEIREKYGFDQHQNIILYLGSIKKIKGSDVLLNAFLKLGDAYVKEKNLRLLFVGEGVMKSELEERVKKHCFQDYVIFFGNVSHEKVPEMYRVADIFVIPSFFEGTPISLLEALFNGLAIIGSNVRGVNTLIQHNKNGLLFEPGNSEDLSKRIRELVNNPDRANRFTESVNNDYLDDYSYEKMINEHITIYENSLEA
jgi:glycosyltransferase involved in cell wall biosynthesis